MSTTEKQEVGVEQGCQERFEKLTGFLSEHTMLHHLVPGKEIEIIIDASGTGLGGCLVQ